MNPTNGDEKDTKNVPRSQSADRKNTEEQPSKPTNPRGERRMEYPGFYMIQGEFNQE